MKLSENQLDEQQQRSKSASHQTLEASFAPCNSYVAWENCNLIRKKWSELINIKLWPQSIYLLWFSRDSLSHIPANQLNGFSRYLHAKTQFHARSHTFPSLLATVPLTGAVYDLNIIVFSNLQKHSMNFKFSYKWFLFMPNEHFASRRKGKMLSRGERTKVEEEKRHEKQIFLINEFR